MGLWSQVYDWPQVAIHLHLLPDGKVLSFADDDDADYHRTGARGSGFSKAYIVDIPNDGPPPPPEAATYVPNTTTDVFCSGHAFMPDGRLLVTGGHIADDVGVQDTNIFDYRSKTWEKAAPMNAGRWYPTTTTLANGEMLTVGGTIDPETFNQLPQVWKVGGGWRDLTGALRDVSGYSPMHLAPNGKVFESGIDISTHYLDTTGLGAWEDVAMHKHSTIRDYGSSVMYDDGKVLVMGGGGDETGEPTNTAEIIDLNDAEPAWKWTDPMKFARRQINATIMADGKVLVTGGTSSPGFNDATLAVLPAEMWDPKTGSWTTLASMKVARLYHSTAILLPDGRVLSAGGGRPAPVNGVDNVNAEIFSPPYLFNGPRPSITSVPATVNYGTTFFVATPDASNIVKATWIRLSSVTHAFNMNQRINHLSVTATAGGLNIAAPRDPNLTPPGHYMLFLINAKGVPSIAKIMQIL
jgi:hypothetical protein